MKNAAPELETQVEKKKSERTPTITSPNASTPYSFLLSELQFDTTALSCLIHYLSVAALFLSRKLLDNVGRFATTLSAADADISSTYTLLKWYFVVAAT